MRLLLQKAVGKLYMMASSSGRQRQNPRVDISCICVLAYSTLRRKDDEQNIFFTPQCI